MSQTLDEYKKQILERCFYKEIELDGKEYKRLSREEKAEYSYFGGMYYKNIPIEIPHDEEEKFIKLKMLKSLMDHRNDIKAIKNILIFLAILVFIAIVVIMR